MWYGGRWVVRRRVDVTRMSRSWRTSANHAVRTKPLPWSAVTMAGEMREMSQKTVASARETASQRLSWTRSAVVALSR